MRLKFVSANFMSAVRAEVNICRREAVAASWSAAPTLATVMVNEGALYVPTLTITYHLSGPMVNLSISTMNLPLFKIRFADGNARLGLASGCSGLSFAWHYCPN